MSKLKIKLYNEGNLVIFRVLEQCESLRSVRVVDYGFRFEASNGVAVRSSDEPGLVSGDVFIRGVNKGRDQRVAAHFLSSEEEAKELIEKVLEALQEFADRGYFEGNKELPKSKEANVYEF